MKNHIKKMGIWFCGKCNKPNNWAEKEAKKK